MNRIATALSHFAEGSNCSQAILSAYAGDLGMDEGPRSALPRVLAAAWENGETCGAVTGAMMVLGMRYGGTTPGREVKERVYAKIRELAARFKARNASLLCRDLLDCDISTPEGCEAAAREACSQRCVRSMCEMPPKSWKKMLAE